MKSKNSNRPPDEDQIPTRQKVREFSEGKFVTIVMTLTTIFALFGDDVRLWMTNKNADPWFFGLFILSLILFSLELLIQSCVVDGFKYGFFFYLDLIATVSLVPDILWF